MANMDVFTAGALAIAVTLLLTILALSGWFSGPPANRD
jgi:hypothetical protein